MFWQLFFIVMGLWVLRYRWRKRRIYKLYREIPSCEIPDWPLLGHVNVFSGNGEDRIKSFQNLGRISIKNGGMTAIWFNNKPYIVVTDPVIADVILKTCLEKDDATMKFFRTLLGNGSIFAPVNIWRPRRKVLAPMFSIKNLNAFVAIFSAKSKILTERLEQEANKGDFSFSKYMTAYTFDSVCKTSLGIDINSQLQPDHPFLDSFVVVGQLVAERMCTPWLYPDFIYKLLQRYKKFSANKKIMFDFVDEIIKTKRKELAAKSSNGNQVKTDADNLRTFMEMLIESSGGDNGFTDVELREEALTMILAGTDTSAITISYTALMLSRYPDVQEKVCQELQEVFRGSNRPVTYEDLPHLKYLEAVIKETLRIYPAVPVIVREVHKDVALPSGTTLVDGVSIIINIWALHRNPYYWGDDAERFRPERFLEGPLQHPEQFIPFSSSMRSCVGQTYAMMSMKTALSTFLRRYRVLPPLGLNPEEWRAPLRVKFDVMMKHVDNYMLRLEHRNKFM